MQTLARDWTKNSVLTAKYCTMNTPLDFCRQVTKFIWLDSVQRCVAQSVTCLATDASLTADPGVASSIPARSHTFVEIDHEIISTVIFLPSAESFKKRYCQ